MYALPGKIVKKIKTFDRKKNFYTLGNTLSKYVIRYLGILINPTHFYTKIIKWFTGIK